MYKLQRQWCACVEFGVIKAKFRSQTIDQYNNSLDIKRNKSFYYLIFKFYLENYVLIRYNISCSKY